MTCAVNTVGAAMLGASRDRRKHRHDRVWQETGETEQMLDRAFGSRHGRSSKRLKLTTSFSTAHHCIFPIARGYN